MNNNTLLLGIDIGWSADRATCGVSAVDPKRLLVRNIGGLKKLSDGESLVFIGKLRLANLLQSLRIATVSIREYEKVVVVVDGPLGPAGKPSKSRWVDSLFRRSPFNGHISTNDVDSGQGPTYVNATYQVVNCFSGFNRPWPWNEPGKKFVVAETKPVVGLCLMNRKIPVENIPSRKNPLSPPAWARAASAIRSKSDFYWRIGGKTICSQILDCSPVADIIDHEEIAGSYCLAVAKSIDKGDAIAVGDNQTGCYVFPSKVHSDWATRFQDRWILDGQIRQYGAQPAGEDFSGWVKASSEPNRPSNNIGDVEQEPARPEAQDDGDARRHTLVLNDNGGVHESCNRWLQNALTTVVIKVEEYDIEARLQRSGKQGQWIIDSKRGKALGLARIQEPGIKHLSSSKSFSFAVTVTSID